MKRTIVLTGLLAAFLTFGSADTITILPAANIAGAAADRDAWLTANFGIGTTAQTLETFENDTRGPWTSLASGVGTFSIMPGGKASMGVGTQKNNFTVLNQSNSPFSGRYDTTPGGKNWLDSNDITELQLSTTLDTIYFFITDANDHNGGLQIQTADGTVAGFPTRTGNGSIFFVGITSSDPIGYLNWINTARADGFGLDDFGTANIPYTASPVPEPATWLVAGCALLILAACVQIRERNAASVKRSSTTRLESIQPGRLR
jgi:hypothetical protein